MGTRKMKLAAYDSELNAKVWSEEVVWRRQIYESGHLSQIRFRADDQLTPGDSLAKKLDQDGPAGSAKISASDLTPGLKDFIQHQNEIYRTQQVTADGADVRSNYQYSFVLPSGEITRATGDSLGGHDLYASARGNSEPRTPPTLLKANLSAIKDPIFACISAETVAEALHAVELAKEFGFNEVWLDTLSGDALNQAIKAAASNGIKLSLAVRPFDYRGPSDFAWADRTLFGDSPPESLARQMADSKWVSVQRGGRQGIEQPGCISPVSAGYQTRQGAIIGLANAPGLTAVHILNPTPHGYNGPRVNYMSFPEPLFLEKGNFGYAEGLRLAFIRDHSIDPIDLCPPSIYTNSDLRQPFFLDDALRASSSIYDGTDQPDPAIAEMLAAYDAWLAKLNHSCLTSLLESIEKENPQLPLSIEALPMEMNAVNRSTSGFVDWKLGDPLPELREGPRQGQQTDFGKFVQHAWVTESNSDYARAVLNYLSRSVSQRPAFAGMVLDFTAFTMKQVDKWIAESFIAAPGH